MKKLLLALILSARCHAALECLEPIVLSPSKSCFITEEGCLDSLAEVKLIVEGIVGCKTRFPKAPCLTVIERNASGGLTFYCGLPQESKR